MLRSYRMQMRRGFAAAKARRAREGGDPWPAFFNELAETAHQRIRSPQGRPTAQQWEIRRLLPFSRSGWSDLGYFARKLGLSPGQLGALLVEDGLRRLAGERKRAPRTPGERPPRPW